MQTHFHNMMMRKGLCEKKRIHHLSLSLIQHHHHHTFSTPCTIINNKAIMKLLSLSLLFGLCSAFAPAGRNTAFLQKSSSLSQNNDVSSTALNVKYKKVFVAGGSRGVGRCVIDKLLANGSEVVALVRSDDAVAELSAIDGVIAIKGDALD